MNYLHWLRKDLTMGLRVVGWFRVVRLGLASIVLLGLVLPVVLQISNEKQYALDAKTASLLGKASTGLSAKFSYDSEKGAWLFNKDGLSSSQSQAQGLANIPASIMKSHVGGTAKTDSLYSVVLPTDSKKGITYHDSNMDLSFRVVPEFKVSGGQQRQGRIIYPFADGGKVVYTAKNNGMEEDIVLSHNIGDSLQFTYKLDLPETLEARPMDDGSIGIYSADPALFGNISYGTNADREKIESARKVGEKTHLVFALPVPVIKQQGSSPSNNGAVESHFKLIGNELRVIATGLSTLRYPIDVDPSVVVTSSADFTAGNNEDNSINFSSGQISRNGLTGGSASGGWTATSSFTTARSDAGVAVYNGYLYLIGGYDGSSYHNDIQYAAINSNGTIGTWATASTTFATARKGLAAEAYNGYLYVLGGYDGTNYHNDIQYAAINSNGTIGTWATTSSFTTVRAYFGSGVVYNNYLYVVSGWNDVSGGLTSVQYAPVKANGSVGTWTATTSLATGRLASAAAVYNGYLYVAGGWNSSYFNDVQYAPINSDGTIGSWTATTSFTTGRYSFGLVPANGYMYIMGGGNGSPFNDVQYATINANGTLGVWNTTSSFTTSRLALGAVSYNGYLYILAGYDGATTFQNDTRYAKIDSAGVTSSFTVSGNTYTSNRNGVQEVANHGFLYVLGGYDSTNAPVNTIFAATINSDGSLGTFTSTGMTAFTTARAFFSAFAYNGFMYVLGGCSSAIASCTTGTNDVATVYKATIASTGTIGSWSAQTSFTTGRFGLSAFAYNDYVYIMGGINGTTFKNDIQFHLLGSSGAISGSWSTSSSTIPTARAYFGATAYGGKLYVAGGCSAGALTCTTARNDVLYAPLSTATGDLSSSLTSTGMTAFTTARGQFGMVIVNGYMYIIGGWDGSTYYSGVQYAQIATDGTVGSWTSVSGSTLSNARAGFGVAAYDGYLYVSGGFDGTSYHNDAQYAQINNGGRAGLGSWSSALNAFTTARFGHVSTAYNGYLYVIGGTDGAGTFLAKTQYAAINADGTLGTWSDSGHDFTTGREDFAGFAYNGFMYIMGGDAGGSQFDDLQYAAINANGTLGSWTTSSNHFLTARSDLSAATYNGYVYITGGNGPSGVLSSVEYAQINSNGSIGSWATTSSFSIARADHAAVAYNGYLYVLGGVGSGTRDEVEYAQTNANGTLGSWAQTTTFGTDRSALTAAAYGGNIYVYGGTPDGTTTSLSDVQYAPINANGTLGTWTFTTSFPTARQYLGGAVYNGYLFVTGGQNGGTATNDVRSAPIKTIARVARYSKLFDLGTNTGTLQSITYNGTLPTGTRAISYKTAGGDAIFGSLSSAASLSGSVSACTLGSVRWLWVDITLDDSNTSGVFGDSLGTLANVTDFTVSFQAKHPAPTYRLHGGKFFVNETLQALDACGP